MSSATAMQMHLAFPYVLVSFISFSGSFYLNVSFHVIEIQKTRRVLKEKRIQFNR